MKHAEAHKLVTRRAAYFSPDRKYRYALWRWWDDSLPSCMFIGLNPSSADDPTIRRCIRFARDWGYGSLCMANLFALRATKPLDMLEHPEPVGPDNKVWLQNLASDAGVVVAAWGVHGVHCGRDREVVGMLGPLKCLRKTKDGFPGHPLYLPADSVLTDYV